MNETEKMQRLHQRAIRGEALTDEENGALQDWYEALDREEDSILNQSQPAQSFEKLHEYLAQTTKKVAEISREIEALVEQNANLRNENQSLIKILESRLLEKVA